MKSILFPVSRLTLAMLRHKYGPGTIRLDRADIRRKELMHTGPKDKHLQRKTYALNAAVKFNLNNHDADHVAGRLREIGYYMYQQDKLRIFQFVWARVTGGLPALQAIYDYYELHNIEEDDYPIETAERLWKRWRADKEKERVYSTPEGVLKNIPVLLSSVQAEAVVNRLVQFMDEKCIDMDPRLKKAVHTLIYYDLTPMTQKEVAKKVDMPQGHVSRSLSRIRAYLPHNEELRKYIAYCLATTKAQPTPSAAS